jgi:hypothetical protein
MSSKHAPTYIARILTHLKVKRKAIHGDPNRQKQAVAGSRENERPRTNLMRGLQN